MHIRQHFKRINLHAKGYKKRDIWLLQYHDFYMEHFGAFFWFYFIFSGVNSRSRPLIKVGFRVRHCFVLIRVSVHMSSWLYVFLTIDKYFCVAFNNKLAFIFSNRKKLSLIILGLFGAICLINVPNLLFRLSEDDQSILECTSTPLVFALRNLTAIFFRTILPIILQIIFSSLLLYKLFKVRRSVLTAHHSMEKEYKFARIILWLNLMIILTETPFLLMTIYVSVFNVTPVVRLGIDSTRDLALTMVIYYSTFVFSMYVFGSLFFVNLFTNHLFQKEILIFLKMIIRKN